LRPLGGSARKIMTVEAAGLRGYHESVTTS
jgi:hypothetical protein